MHPPVRDLGLFEFDPALKGMWRRGALPTEWASRYPQLFDQDDIRLVRSQGSRGYHFIEWISAIALHELTGYHSLVSKYEFGTHPRKTEVLRKVLSPHALGFIRARTASRVTRCPDLFMYAPDFSGAFFCEVKGPGDRLRSSQLEFFGDLELATNLPVRLIRMRERRA